MKLGVGKAMGCVPTSKGKQQHVAKCISKSLPAVAEWYKEGQKPKEELQ